MPLTSARFVSRLTHNTLALVLAGGRGSRLGVLTDWRAKPAVPFGGKFRIIDFTLSNCLNSDIRRIAVLTQYKSHALIQHLLQGWNWFKSSHGEFVDLVPAQQWLDEESWYQGTADAVFQTLDIIESYGPEYVLILAGDHVYKMDYGEMLATHADSDAALTIACTAVPRDQATGFGVMAVDRTGMITEFQEKPADPAPMPDNPDASLVSMGIYVFSREYLREELERDATDKASSHDFGKDIIPHVLGRNHRVQCHRFDDGGSSQEAPYWRDVGTLDAFFQANMELLTNEPPLKVHGTSWPITTYQPQLPPGQFIGHKTCHARNSMVSSGCMVMDSELDNTLLFSDVTVHEDCTLNGVLALPGSNIGAGSRLTNVILDNHCQVPPNTVIGENPAEDRVKYNMTANGVVVVNRKMLGQTQYAPEFSLEF